MSYLVMVVLKDFEGSEVFLHDEVADHISMRHPEISQEQVSLALTVPCEVRKSSHKKDTKLYYRKKSGSGKKLRFVVVVVKTRSDGSWIDTAMTASKIKDGELLFIREKISGE